MTDNTNPVDINSLPSDRQRKVRKIRGKLRMGSFVICSRIMDSKTVNRLLRKTAPQPVEESSMSDTMLRYRLNELIREFSIADRVLQRKSAVLARRPVRAKQQVIKKSIKSVQELLDHLRVCIKYQVFDLEATRRENTHLKKLLEGG